MKRRVLRSAVFGLIAAAGIAEAQTCDPRWPAVQFVRDDLQRAASEGDLPTAQDYADRARREFDHLAGLATRCGCVGAVAKFEDAARQIRRAQDAESRRDLREVIGATRPIFDAALLQLQECGRR